MRGRAPADDREFDEMLAPQAQTMQAIKRWGTPEEVAYAVLYLASDFGRLRDGHRTADRRRRHSGMSGSTPSEATLATVVAAVLSRFGLSDAASATLINVAENWTYRVQDPTSEFVAALRVQRPGYHTGAEIESEIMWLDALHADR
ncbi:MAG: hypothetical protein U0S48_06875 [Solirubrobacteraceae bacterium]